MNMMIKKESYRNRMTERIILEELSPKEYEHPLDRKAINTLEAIPGLEH